MFRPPLTGFCVSIDWNFSLDIRLQSGIISLYIKEGKPSREDWMRNALFSLIFSCGLAVSTTFAYDWSTNPGTGDPNDPYQISTPEQLMAIGSDPNLLDKCFMLMNDIVFDPDNNPAHIFTTAIIAPNLNSGGLYYYLGTPFTGTFYGRNHSLKNVTIEAGTDYTGLFGYTENSVVKNLRLKNIFISSGWEYTGGLAGYSTSSSFTACHVSGSVNGTYNVGGLLGFNQSGPLMNCSTIVSVTAASRNGGLIGTNTGSLFACFAAGSVTNAFTRAGGLVGHNDGSLTACYATGSVSSAYSAGGLVGVNTGSLSACYSTGSVSAASDVGGLLGSHAVAPIQSCYFLNTAGPDNGYGQPLDDPNMMIRSNFLGWDFVDDGLDGSNNIWRMCIDGIHYPKLSWEVGQFGDFTCPDGVGMEDLEALAFHWLTEDIDPDINYACDGSGDGRINQQEMDILSEHWRE